MVNSTDGFAVLRVAGVVGVGVRYKTAGRGAAGLGEMEKLVRVLSGRLGKCMPVECVARR